MLMTKSFVIGFFREMFGFFDKKSGYFGIFFVDFDCIRLRGLKQVAILVSSH